LIQGTVPVIAIENGRTLKDWLSELVGAGLRTQAGIPWSEALQKAQAEFTPRPAVVEAFHHGMLRFQDGRLVLAEAEWFRELGWASELLRSLRFRS
jgi:hypothetical protein